METRLIQPRVWIASYTASEHAGTLSRGLFFRSIHDSKEDAETFRRDPYAKDLTITEYVLAAAPPEDTIASLPRNERPLTLEEWRDEAIKDERTPDQPKGENL